MGLTHERSVIDMRTHTNGIMTILFLVIGALFVSANPASAVEDDNSEDIVTVQDEPDEKEGHRNNDNTSDEKPVEKYATVCHYKADQTFAYWATLTLGAQDAEWHLAHGDKLTKGACGNNTVTICKNYEGSWILKTTDPETANWMIATGTAKTVKACKEKPEPTPEPTPEVTPEPTPEIVTPEPTPEVESVVEVVIEEEEEEEEEEVAKEAEGPQSEAEVLNETVTRSELAFTGTNSADLAGYALILLGAGFAMSMGATRLRRETL